MRKVNRKIGIGRTSDYGRLTRGPGAGAREDDYRAAAVDGLAEIVQFVADL